MNNIENDYLNQPRYQPGGIKKAVFDEEIAKAKKQDMENAAIGKLGPADIPDEGVDTPKPDPISEWDSLAESTEEIATQFTHLPRSMAGGVLKGTENIIKTVVGSDNYNAANEYLYQTIPGLREFDDLARRGMEPVGFSGEITHEMSKFMFPMFGFMKASTAIAAKAGVTLQSIPAAFIGDLLSSGTAMNPHMERFSELGKMLGVENQFIDWLADNEDETESEGRLKNMLDATVGAGSVGAAFVSSALLLKGMYRASKQVPKVIDEIVTPKVGAKGQKG